MSLPLRKNTLLSLVMANKSCSELHKVVFFLPRIKKTDSPSHSRACARQLGLTRQRFQTRPSARAFPVIGVFSRELSMPSPRAAKGMKTIVLLLVLVVLGFLNSQVRGETDDEDDFQGSFS